ncbi:nucleotidyltransferase domain-containing protein [Curtobacterium albidum]|uniref:nucleotidyltransferase domain-containing protein n=1 Tax=Curtobacterium citreum TaxID=2036 RepID=UPI002025DC10|nr:nucleotidyltransferase domain-containing protein [Curtobacterium albidum]MCL9666678.1 nucleotidyltransferase domain-containing protein [Curtobacterium albidum]
MRNVPDSLDPTVVAEIDARLAGVQAAHGVAVPWAIESGSRAWGFPSPDSDYDCRFVYVRQPDAYLSLWPERDVIETPLDAVFDVNGWDLGKAVRLAVNGNATVGEWLRSPIVYSGDEGFRDRALALLAAVADRGRIGRHHLHVALRQQERQTTLKRFFYVLRPATTLRWLREHPDSALPPMDLPTLVQETSVPTRVRDAVTDLIEVKAVTRELGTGSAPDVLERFVADELDRAAAFDDLPPRGPSDEARARADDFFRGELARLTR